MKTKKRMLVTLLSMFLGFALMSVFAVPQFVQEQLTQKQYVMQEEVNYDEQINKEDLPEMITANIKDAFSDFEITEVYKGSDGSYKVKIENDEKQLAVFYNSDALFMHVENLEFMANNEQK